MFQKALFLVFSFLSAVSLARGQTESKTPNTPDITGWKKTNFTVIDISSEKGPVIYLGYEAEYQNPNNPNEFVKIVSRYISFVSVPADQTDKTPYVNIANNYLDNDINESLDNLINNESDPFLYIRWKTLIDGQTGQLIPDGSIESWLLNSTGSWFYKSGGNVLVKNISEPNKYNPEEFISVGRKYSLNGTHHVLMVDQDYLVKERK